MDGVITRFLDGNQLEIETNDGFLIPVLRQDVVFIHQEEAENFGKRKRITFSPFGSKTTQEKEVDVPKVVAEKGFFFAFVPATDKMLDVYLINNTDLDILFSLSSQYGGDYEGIYAQMLRQRNFMKIHEVNIDTFEKWSSWILQILFHQKGKGKYRSPLIKKMNFKADKFFKIKKTAPLINKEAHLFEIDTDNAPPKSLTKIAKEVSPTPSSKASAEEIKEKMLSKNTFQSEVRDYEVVLPPLEVDLHIECLVDEPEAIDVGDILSIQMREFDTRLDQAIASNVAQITFIHGIGNGILKGEIQRRLSKHPHIKYYKDAQKERFGYGATLVKF
jgi:hypothetical protein